MENPKNQAKWTSVLAIMIFVGLYLLWPSLEFDSEPTTTYPPTSDPSTQVPSTEVLLPIPVEPNDSPIIWYELYFTSPVIPFNDVTTGGIEDRLIEKIDRSLYSIDLAVYEFDLENVAQALIDSKNRGVKVRIVYDNEFTDPDPQMRQMINAGIKAVPDDRSAFMHNKFFIFDNSCIWTGSFNISVNAAYRNNEDAIYFCSEKASENYTDEFNEMFTGNFGASSPSNTPYPVFMIGNIKIEIYFAPEDHVMEILVNRVGSAQKSIHFMAFSFTDDSLGEAMIAALKRGVSVAGIFETRGADTQYSECPPLLQQGADVTLDGNPRTFHHKVIIIDSRIVILGSFNFTASADKENDENLLIIYDESLASAYEAEFLRMKALSHETLANSCQAK